MQQGKGIPVISFTSPGVLNAGAEDVPVPRGCLGGLKPAPACSVARGHPRVFELQVLRSVPSSDSRHFQICVLECFRGIRFPSGFCTTF